MPRQNKSKTNTAQAKITRQDAIALRKSSEARRKSIAQERKQLQKAKDAELKAFLNSIRGMGIYQPKSRKLTPYRRKRTRKAKREYGEKMKHSFFVPVPKSKRKETLRRAEGLKIEHTRTGIIVPKEGHTDVKLRRGKKGELFIERSGKTKMGPKKGRSYRSVTPLADLSELDRERDKIKRAAERLGPTTSNGKIMFRVNEDGLEGISMRIFDNVENLMKWLDNYDKTDAARINFYRHITVELVEPIEWRRLRQRQVDNYVPKKMINTGRYNTRRYK